MTFTLDEVRGREREREIARENEIYEILTTKYSQNPYRKGSHQARLWEYEKRQLENEKRSIILRLF